MSFLQPKIIPRGYIATTSNKTTPRKRLNSISEISLKPSLPNLLRPYVKRAKIDPFEQHYVTPFLRMFDEEEEENAIKQNENAIEQNEKDKEKDKEIRQTIDDISTFVRRAGGLPTWGVRKLRRLKKKYFPDDDVNVSSDLEAWNEEEKDRLERERATHQVQGLLTSMYQQKGYDERMDATENLQALLKAQKQEVIKERKRPRRDDDDDDDDDDVVFEHPHPPVLKKSRTRDVFTTAPSFNLDLNQIEQQEQQSRNKNSSKWQITKDILKFLNDYEQLSQNPEDIPDEIHEKLSKYLMEKQRMSKELIRYPTILYKSQNNPLADGYYIYNPTTRDLFVLPGTVGRIIPISDGYFYI